MLNKYIYQKKFNSRCVYLTYLKNHAKFQDDFWSRFISLWIVGAASLWHGSLLLLQPSFPMSYYMCTGQDPSQLLSSSSTASSFQEIAGIVIFTLATLRIRLYRKTRVQGTNNIKHFWPKIELIKYENILGVIYLLC